MENLESSVLDNQGIPIDSVDINVRMNSGELHGNEITNPSDVHDVLEKRVTELWEKLEETNANLNSCDDILETYCKYVTEKLNEKCCPRCRTSCPGNEGTDIHLNKVEISLDWPPSTLLEGISNALQNIKKTISYVIIPDFETVDLKINKEQPTDDQIISVSDFCGGLHDILSKMKYLESCISKYRQEEDNDVLEDENVDRNSTTVESDWMAASEDFNHSQDYRGEEKPMEPVEELKVSSPDKICFVASTAILCAVVAEDKTIEKQRKRGILGYDSAGLGYSALGVHNIGFTGLSNYGLGLGIGNAHLSGLGLSSYGPTFGYATAAAPLAIAPLAAPIKVAPVVKTLLASHPIRAVPIHAPALSVAAPISAHLPAFSIQAPISDPISAHLPTLFGAHFPTKLVTHHFPTSVHITEPIKAHITPHLSAPIVSVGLSDNSHILGLHVKPLKTL